MPIKQPCQKAGGATGLPEESASPDEMLEQAPSKIARVRQRIAKSSRWRYGTLVPAKSGAGFRSPIKQKAHKRPKTIAGAIFLPVVSLYGGCVWGTFGCAGFLLPRYCEPAHSCHHSPFRSGSWQLPSKRSSTMKQYPARNPSTLREHAASHRALALAALRADSSLSVRLRRYNHHMSSARALEAIAERLEATTTRDPRTALSWLQSGQSVHIDAVNLADHLRHIRALATLEAVGGEA